MPFGEYLPNARSLRIKSEIHGREARMCDYALRGYKNKRCEYKIIEKREL